MAERPVLSYRVIITEPVESQEGLGDRQDAVLNIWMPLITYRCRNAQLYGGWRQL